MMSADPDDVSDGSLTPHEEDAGAIAARVRHLAAGELRRAARARAVALSHEARSAAGPQSLRELRARMAALHRQAEERHQASAALHELYAARMESWLAGEHDQAFRPAFMSAVAAAIGARSATATVRGLSPSAVVAASSDATARAAYDLEAALGQGPAVAAAATGAPVRVGGPALYERWPLYGPAVAGLGVRAVTAVPLQVPGNCLGALSVYSAAPVISDAVAAAAGRVADALTHTVLLSGRGSLDGLFGEADFRAEIHQATGMVAARCGCGIDDAQALLHARAFADGQPVELVARGVLRGETRLW